MSQYIHINIWHTLSGSCVVYHHHFLKVLNFAVDQAIDYIFSTVPHLLSFYMCEHIEQLKFSDRWTMDTRAFIRESAIWRHSSMLYCSVIVCLTSRDDLFYTTF